MKFYTNFFIKWNKLYLRGYEDNKLIEKIIDYKPYMFIPKKGGKYTTLDGKDVEKMSFSTIKEAKDFISNYSDVDNFEIYGLDNFQYVYIYDNYLGEIQYDYSLISVVSIDIECVSDDGFPDIDLANKEITAITIRKNGMAYVFGCGEFISSDKNITYIRSKNESELLRKFLEVWNFKSIKPDIVTGWNIEMFDIPYLVNRINKVLGENEGKLLSPWKIIDEKEIDLKSKVFKTYSLLGITILDYYQIYRKFKFGNQESYKLDYIAQEELGENKLDYSEYGSLDNLYRNNFQKYIEYNINDTILVDKLEDKLGFIQQIIAFAYDAKVNYIDTMTTVRPWDVIIHNFLLDRRIVIPQFKKKESNQSLIGGYVKEPKLGMSKWVVSFDLTSLYPHLIMGVNISPDTFVTRLNQFETIDNLLNNTYDSNKQYSCAANGCLYRKDKQGFLSALMEKMYNDRSTYKKKMIEAKKIYEEIENEMKKRSLFI